MADTVTIPGYLGHSIEPNPHHPQETGQRIRVRCREAGQTSDGFHIFDELYDHRNLLFCCFVRGYGGWKSRLHDDGSSIEGWFIAGTEVGGMSVTYHLPESMWDICHADVYDKAPKFDGHSSLDVIDRLKSWLHNL